MEGVKSSFPALCVKHRMLVPSNSKWFCGWNKCTFPINFCYLKKSWCCCACLTGTLIWACCFHSAAPHTFLTWWTFIISRTSNFCQAEHDQSIKIITGGNGCTDSATVYISFPAIIKHPQHLISSPLSSSQLTLSCTNHFWFTLQEYITLLTDGLCTTCKISFCSQKESATVSPL